MKSQNWYLRGFFKVGRKFSQLSKSKKFKIEFSIDLCLSFFLTSQLGVEFLFKTKLCDKVDISPALQAYTARQIVQLFQILSFCVPSFHKRTKVFLTWHNIPYARHHNTLLI